MELSPKYSPAEIEQKWYKYWLENNLFHSEPDEREPFTVVIPPPNVTGVLHMGHMLNNTIQDVLVRRARMQGKNACWVPGTDHASIATEAKVVNKLAAEGIKKTDLTREEFLAHAWEWTHKHGGIILEQLKKLGASCDWDRTAFTMDKIRSESVLKVFCDLYDKGLIYRGVRMVNWDPKALTAVSDEEVNYKEQQGKLYYLKYKIVENGNADLQKIQPAVLKLQELGQMPDENDEEISRKYRAALLSDTIERYLQLLEEIETPVNYNEAKILLNLFPEYSFFEVEYQLLHKFETIFKEISEEKYLELIKQCPSKEWQGRLITRFNNGKENAATRPETAENSNKIAKKADKKYSKIINAWEEAALDLGFEIEMPFNLKTENGIISYALLIKQFGSPLGTLIQAMDDYENTDSIPAQYGYYTSFLNPYSYNKYKREHFIETLTDWGYYGNSENKPDWYKGVDYETENVETQFSNEQYAIVATTRPETIFGDTAMCINPNNPKTAHLKGKRVIVPICNREIPVIEDEYVDMEFGTGCLKVTPAHDINDYMLGEKYNLPSIDIFNDNGTLNANGLHYEGKDRFVVRKEIEKELKESGLMEKIEAYTNKVGFSERTDVPIEPKLSMQWFLKMDELAKPALENVENDTIKFYPEKFKNTYRHWLTNIKDWCISRQLWWGHRIPAWFVEVEEEKK